MGAGAYSYWACSYWAHSYWHIPIGPFPIWPIPIGPILIGPVPIGPSPIGPIPIGHIPVGHIPIGLIPIGPIPVWPIPIGPVPIGPLSILPIPIGPLPIGPIPIGPIPIGPIPIGSIPIGHVPVGPIPVGPIPIGPIPIGLVPAGPIHIGPIPIGPIPIVRIPMGPIPIGPIRLRLFLIVCFCWLERGSLEFCTKRSSRDEDRLTMQIEATVTVSGADLRNKVTIPASHLSTESGHQFFHVFTYPRWAAVLFGTTSSKTERSLSRTDVIDQITQLRNSKLNDLITEKQPQQALSNFRCTTWSKRLKTEHKMSLPQMVSVRTPDIGEVRGIDVRVLLGWKQTAPLWVELTAESVAYLRQACMWQIMNGEFKRTKIPKKLPKKPTTHTHTMERDTSNECEPEDDHSEHEVADVDMNSNIDEEADIDENDTHDLSDEAYDEKEALARLERLENALIASSAPHEALKIASIEPSTPISKPKRTSSITSYFRSNSE